MTDAAWARGLADLVVAFPIIEDSDEVRSHRGRTYRQHLDDLEDKAWAYAVSESIRCEKWFPTVAQLRAYAVAMPPDSSKFLPAPKEGSDEEAKATARAGLEMIRKVLADRGIQV